MGKKPIYQTYTIFVYFNKSDYFSFIKQWKFGWISFHFPFIKKVKEFPQFKLKERNQ